MPYIYDARIQPHYKIHRETRLKELFKQLKTRYLRWGCVLHPADVLLYKDQYTSAECHSAGLIVSSPFRGPWHTRGLPLCHFMYMYV